MEFHEQITIGLEFFVFAFLASLGFWQILAAYQGLRALSLLPRGTSARWSYLLGAGLIALPCVWFFGTRAEDVFSPGPASSEFLFFLSLGLLCALGTTIVGSIVVDRVSLRGENRGENPYRHREAVSTSWWQGTLYLPESDGRPWRAVCIVPGPTDRCESASNLAERLAREDVAALVIDTSERKLWRYPDVLATVSQAMSYLGKRGDLDRGRFGLLGVGLGADLVIRAAASDRQVGSVVALSPLLTPSTVQPGLDLLRENSYIEALRWRRVHQGGQLVSQLAALEHSAGLDSRPLLVICGGMDRLALTVEEKTLPAGAQLKLVEGVGRTGLAQNAEVLSSSVGWFLSHLQA
jgi:hypothetical protein